MDMKEAPETDGGSAVARHDVPRRVLPSVSFFISFLFLQILYQHSRALLFFSLSLSGFSSTRIARLTNFFPILTS